MVRRHTSAWPRTGRPPTSGRDPDDGGAGAAQGVAHAGDAEDDADRDDGVARRQDDDVGLADRVEHARGRGGAVEAGHDEPLGRQLGAVPHPPLLEVDRALLAVLLDDDVGLDGGVGHRQEAYAELAEPPAGGEPVDDGAQRHTLAEQLRAVDVGAEVLVARA